MSSAEGLQATNNDATLCKRYAVGKGYWNDPYIGLFTCKSPPPRTPEISRGYFARVLGTKILLDNFIKVTHGKCQIVNLGAGFDTLYWRLCDEGRGISAYVDVDFPQTTSKKCHCICSKPRLLDRLKEKNAAMTTTTSDLHAHPYHLIGANLCDLPSLTTKLLKDSSIDTSLPTVFIAECVLVYLATHKSQELIRWIAEMFTTVFFINYEQVNIDDRFGLVMQDNLRSRDCQLLGVEACASLESQKLRIEQIEMLDDREVIEQLFHHYCISWAYKDPNHLGLSQIDFTVL